MHDRCQAATAHWRQLLRNRIDLGNPILLLPLLILLFERSGNTHQLSGLMFGLGLFYLIGIMMPDQLPFIDAFCEQFSIYVAGGSV